MCIYLYVKSVITPGTTQQFAKAKAFRSVWTYLDSVEVKVLEQYSMISRSPFSSSWNKHPAIPNELESALTIIYFFKI